MIKERTAAGKAIARQKPGYKEGRPKQITPKIIKQIKKKAPQLYGAVISCADTFLHLQILHVVWIIAAHHCVPSATPACFATR